MKSSTAPGAATMARRREQATTSAPKAGKAGPAVVNVSGQHWPGAEEVTRYSGPARKPARTVAHRRPVMVDQAASNRSVELTEACVMDGPGRHMEKRRQMRSAAESRDADPWTRGTVRWITGLWPAKTVAR